jgi:multidrug efflux pump subunit AcrA (membrane-fusion protein)
LTPGASAVAGIPLGIRENTLLLPSGGAYLTTGGQKYIYIVENSKAYKTNVISGEIQGSQIKILNGVKSGD